MTLLTMPDRSARPCALSSAARIPFAAQASDRPTTRPNSSGASATPSSPMTSGIRTAPQASPANVACRTDTCGSPATRASATARGRMPSAPNFTTTLSSQAAVQSRKKRPAWDGPTARVTSRICSTARAPLTARLPRKTPPWRTERITYRLSRCCCSTSRFSSCVELLDRDVVLGLLAQPGRVLDQPDPVARHQRKREQRHALRDHPRPDQRPPLEAHEHRHAPAAVARCRARSPRCARRSCRSPVQGLAQFGQVDRAPGRRRQAGHRRLGVAGAQRVPPGQRGLGTASRPASGSAGSRRAPAGT